MSADKFCKQFGPRSGPTKCRALSESNLFDSLMVFLKEFSQKIDFEKTQQTTKIHENLPECKALMDNTEEINILEILPMQCW